MDGAETRLFSSCQRTPMNLMFSWQTRRPLRAGQDGAQKEKGQVEKSLIKPIPPDHPCRGAPIGRIVTWICSADRLHLRAAVAVQNFVGSWDSKAECRDDGRFIDAVPQLIRSTLCLSPVSLLTSLPRRHLTCTIGHVPTPCLNSPEFPVDAKYPLSGLVSSTGIAPS
ncbi:hypothetical protein M404DRAFT_713014 [Pisolithus tinctorius Marx 270]|uniref:Uncharacterized protein n=1 Tax=Pisolithus tinctorius Marx 270 TaxID=870435 RepID=A0A0C3JXH6_PISTI|nr:hypothetical protein M404DRAFT_713014 [Pisolithus tinctorius Marx 270]